MPLNEELAKTLNQAIQELKAATETLHAYERRVRSGNTELNEAFRSALKQDVKNTSETVRVWSEAITAQLERP